MTELDGAERARLIDLAGGGINPYWNFLGITVNDVLGPGDVVMGLPLRHELSNLGAVMHGGAIMSLVDAAAGGAFRSHQQSGETLSGGASIDIAVSFLRPAQGNVTARGRIIRRGRRIAFAQVDVSDEAGNLIAVGRATMTVNSSS